MTVTDELQLFIDILPLHVQKALAGTSVTDLDEVILDLGRLPEARFAGGTLMDLGDIPVSYMDIQGVVRHLVEFTNDNRSGIPRTLHRISAIRNRQGEIIGLTCRVGKVVTGTIECILDIVESGKSILILGRPGVGKTTKLREMARMIANDLMKRVVLVDTSNEIAGDGDIPHPVVGRARRMQVRSPELQQNVMIEAVENHTPEVIIVDEIGTEAEAMAARTIAERGVTLIATAHGGCLENIIKNPTLSDLIGGVETVTLGDDEAKRRDSQKTVLERAKQPTFDICIELRDRHTLAVYPNVAEAVDHVLRGWTLYPEVRKVDVETGATKILKTTQPAEPVALPVEPAGPAKRDNLKERDGGQAPVIELFLYAINRNQVDQILERLHVEKFIHLTSNIHEAHAVLALHGQARPGSKIMRLAKDYEVPIFYVKSNTMPQIQRTMRDALEVVAVGHPELLSRWPNRFDDQPAALEEMVGDETASNGNGYLVADETTLALQEAKEAVDRVLQNNEPVELNPKRSYLRRLQHELIEKHNLNSVSIGQEPNRRLKVLPIL